MSQNETPVRDNHFSDAELACEFLQHELEASALWERCYPFYDETSHFWSAYLVAKERAETIESIALGEHI